MARALARRAGDPIAEAHASRDLGAAFEVRGDYPKAQEAWQRALAVFEALGVPEADEVRARLTAA